MSDFLTRLAQRQLGQIATIEPRVPGLYAPLADEIAFRDMGFDVEHRPVDTEVDREIVAMARKSSTRVPTKDPVVATDSSAGVPPIRPQPLSREHRLKVDRPLQIEVEAGDENRPRTNNEQFPAEVSTLISPKLKVEPRTVDSLSEEQPELLASEPAPLVKRRVVAQEKTPSPVQHLLPVQPLLVERKESDRVAAPRPFRGLKAPGAISRRSTPLQSRMMDASGPPVQVTIGRIEVTALTAAAPPKRMPVTRKPSMSLDDYLARRQGRER